LALKESAISKQLTICPKIKIWIPNFTRKYFSKQKLLFTVKIKSYLEIKLDIFSSKQQRFIKQRKFTWQSPLYGISEHTSVQLNQNYQKKSISDLYVCTKAKHKTKFWFKQKNSVTQSSKSYFLLRRQK
jgi:hypothetical protein